MWNTWRARVRGICEHVCGSAKVVCMCVSGFFLCVSLCMMNECVCVWGECLTWMTSCLHLWWVCDPPQESVAGAVLLPACSPASHGQWLCVDSLCQLSPLGPLLSPLPPPHPATTVVTKLSYSNSLSSSLRALCSHLWISISICFYDVCVPVLWWIDVYELLCREVGMFIGLDHHGLRFLCLDILKCLLCHCLHCHCSLPLFLRCTVGILNL